MCITGPQGLKRIAAAGHANTRALAEKLHGLDGVRVLFNSPFFHEIVVRLERAPKEVLAALAQRNIMGGLDLAEYYPELGPAMLVCATETKTGADLDHYINELKHTVNAD